MLFMAQFHHKDGRSYNYRQACEWNNTTESSIWVKSAIRKKKFRMITWKTLLPSVSLASRSRSPPNISNKKHIM